MAATWRDYAKEFVFILGLLALMYAAMTANSTPDLVVVPRTEPAVAS